MEINETNKKLYEDAFVGNGEYGIVDDGWKPSINESEIEEWCGDDEGNWRPATPLGYRDYKLSREEGLKNIIYNDDNAKAFTYEESHKIKRGDNLLKQYDHITIDGKSYVVTADDETKFYIVDEENHHFYIDYLSE